MKYDCVICREEFTQRSNYDALCSGCKPYFYSEFKPLCEQPRIMEYIRYQFLEWKTLEESTS